MPTRDRTVCTPKPRRHTALHSSDSRGRMSPTLTVRSTSSRRLDELDSVPDSVDPGQMLDDRRALDRMMTLIHRWDPIDRQVTLLYLEGMDAASIGEIAGISPGSVATKIHRVKTILARRFHEGTP